MNYAILKDGVVVNIIYIHDKNRDEFPEAIALNNIPAGIGDTYVNGVFYRNGERLLTDAEELEQMYMALSLLGVNVDE